MSDDPLGPLTPFLILSREDGTFAVAARGADEIISLAPLVGIPDAPRRRLISCPCCRRWLILSEWADGHTTVERLSKPLRDEEPP